MDPLCLEEIAAMAGGRVLSGGDPGLTVSRISKDTRTIESGDLYLALRGENFDGNDFVDQAVARGAAAALVDRDVSRELAQAVPLILVDDALAALQRLASAWRDRLNLRVVAITGSSGKTSTKEFTAAVLSARYRVTKTLGNLNNHFGLPLTILNATTSDQAAVWEIGMNHPGEIAPLAAIARPGTALITNIGVAHIEFFPDRAGIAAEKSCLAASVPPTGTVILPAEDDYADFLASRARGRVIRTGLLDGEIRGKILGTTESTVRFQVDAYGESLPAHLPVAGEHMVRNALLAIATGLSFGMALEECIQGIATARLTGGRLQQKVIRGVRLLDDTYNANPDSMEAALRTVAAVSAGARRIAVLGRMGELGSYAEMGYERVGATAASCLDTLITVGPEAATLCRTARTHGLEDVHETRDTLEAARLLRSITRSGDLVLIKGSRAARMEQVIGGFED